MQYAGFAGNGLRGGCSPEYWEKIRAFVLASVYTGGVLTSVPSSTTAGVSYTLPAECSSAIRYTIDDPGGREGGSPAYADLWMPSAALDCRCLVFMSGHGSGGWESCWNIGYSGDGGSSIIRRMLARGWMVLAIDMPAYGVQPQPQLMYSAGKELSLPGHSGHTYLLLFSDGGPSPNRLYLDHAIRAMNQIVVDYPTVRFALAGHSGGGAVAAMLGAVEERFRAVHLLQWTGPQNSTGETESWAANPMCVAAQGTPWTLGLVGATVAGRATVMHSGPSDEYVAAYYAANQAYAAQCVQMLNWAGGPSLAFFPKLLPRDNDPFGIPYHNIDATQAAFVEAHLLANT